MDPEAIKSIAFVYPADSHSGIALYSRIIMRGMSQLGVNVGHISSPDQDHNHFHLLNFQIGGSKHHAFVWRLFNQLSKRPDRPLMVATVHEPTLWNIAVDFKTDYYSLAKKRFYFEMIYHFGINLPLRSILKVADGCVVLSHFLRESVKARNLYVIAHPILPELKWEKRCLSPPFRIFAPGFICPLKSKGIEDLLVALSGANFFTELIINSAGANECDHSALHKLLCFADKFKDRVKVIQTGFTSDALFLDHFRTSDLIYIPRASTNGEISSPMYYALGAGTPLLVPRLDAFCEIQRNGYPLFYRAGDLNSIKDAINHVRDNYESVSSTSLREREHWLKVCSPRQIAEQHLELYRDLAAKTPTRSGIRVR